MRGYDRPQSTMLTLVNPEQRVPANHPIRLIKALAEVALKELSPLFEQMYSEVGRPSLPPERLLKASQTIYCRRGKPWCNWIIREIDDRHCTGLRIGFFLPRIWNPVSRTAVDPWRFARDGDDRRLHRTRSVDAGTG